MEPLFALPPEVEPLLEPIRRLSSPLLPQPTSLEPSPPPMEGVRAVLFDIYGTLFVSASGDIGPADRGGRDEAAFRAALEAAGGDAGRLPPGFSGSRRYREVIAAHHAAARARGVEWPEVEILEVWEEVLSAAGMAVDLPRLAVEYECRTNPVWPMPGLLEVVREVVGHGLLVGIVSNAQFYTPLLFPALLGTPLGELGFRPEFCAWSWREGEAKPSPRLFAGPLEALREEWGIHPGEVLYLGNDMLKDILPAHRLGLRPVLFAGDRRSLRLRPEHPHCRHLSADGVITDLRQLIE